MSHNNNARGAPSPLNVSRSSTLKRSTSGSVPSPTGSGQQRAPSPGNSGVTGAPTSDTNALASRPTGVAVPNHKLPVGHKVLAAEAYMANAAAAEQQMLAAHGRAPPPLAGHLANAHRAPTPAVIRSPVQPAAEENDHVDAIAAAGAAKASLNAKAAQQQGTFGIISARVAPARVRASPALPGDLHAAGVTAVPALAVRELLKRPPSGQTRGTPAVDASGNMTSLPSLVDGAAGRTFEEELMDIAAQRFGPDARRRNEQRSDASRGPSVLGFSSPVGGANSSVRGAGRTPSPPPGMEDQYEGTTDTGEGVNPATATGKPLHVPYTPDIRAKLSVGAAPHSHTAPKPMSLTDYRVLAQACQRAGRARTECHAYYKIAELLSAERQTLPKSVAYFKRYLNLCRRLADLQGEAKALNSLGIVHHRLGGAENLNTALEFHQRHLEIADAAGVFIAQTNRGLVFHALRQPNESMECLKQALQYAVRAGDRQAEALALANLGLAGSTNGDFSTARVCVERQLELNTALHDGRGSCEAYEQLGALAMQRGDTTGAAELLVTALDLALKADDQTTAQRVRCQIGIVQSVARTEDHMRAAAARMNAK